MTPLLGYCTNVHAGADLTQTRANLEEYAVAVKRLASPGGPMGVGLWLSARSARELLAGGRLAAWRDWLAGLGLVPYTVNGFPYGDFHSDIVKHDVYKPEWTDPARFDFTRDLIRVTDGLAPPGRPASISTLPLAWGAPGPTRDMLDRAAHWLREAAAELARLEADAGRLVTLCVEPEPGCHLQYSRDIVDFFEGHLLPGGDEGVIRRHVGVCHDVCHADVMFESQREALNRYAGAGITVGKVQVSAAVRADFDAMPAGERDAAKAQLAAFNEPRYLHQTCVRPTPGATPIFHEDLHAALAAHGPAGEWRVHFHVPIYLQRFGRLAAMRPAVEECLRFADPASAQYEVETYAWGVLPGELRRPLAEGIAEEIRWLQETITAAEN